jgi:sigma-B regulation protein RsbU (phosphoserine phosphatase)
MADVADKGMHAALVMAVTRTLFFQEAPRSLSPAAVALAVHHGLMGVGGSQSGYGIDAFVTAFYGVLHRPSGRLVYVRAAQDRPLLLRPGEPPLPLPGDGRFLGMLDNLELPEYMLTLRPGDFLLLYSDGVTDARNERDQSYGLDRLKGAMQAALSQPARESGVEETLRQIVADINQWRGGAPAFDDVTMLLVEACQT